MRLFLAIALPDPVRDALGRLIAGLREQLPRVKWVRAESIHLTLKFLGEAEAGRVEPLTRALRGRISGGAAALSLAVRGVGRFPARGRPRVLWAGLESDGALTLLRDAVEETCAQEGFPRETRPFHPHLTLARLGDGPPPAGLDPALERAARWEGGIFEADALTLYQSFLEPAGARHLQLARIPLR